jgi:hypothetical protein
MRPAAVPLAGAGLLPAEAIDLLAGVPAASWTVRSQAGHPTCVAHAAAACIELMRARRNGACAPVALLSARFLDQRIRVRRQVAPEAGASSPGTGPVVGAEEPQAKLGEAALVLSADGICRKESWDEPGMDPDERPGEAVLAEAAQNTLATALYEDWPEPDRREPGVARRVLEELRAGRPVAIALPGLRDARLKHGPTTWDRPDVWQTGMVPDPCPGDVPVPGSGHAVCVLGFQPSGEDALGGYFVFRNSWDTRFGRLAFDVPPRAAAPRVPMPGYGTISASHVEAYCWEMLSLTF